ncbi:MAG: hypothetical protein ACUVUR_00010 [bacterium]
MADFSSLLIKRLTVSGIKIKGCFLPGEWLKFIVVQNRLKMSGVNWRLERLRRMVVLWSLFGLALVGSGLAALVMLGVAVLFLSGWLMIVLILPLGVLSFLWLKEARIRPVGYRLERFFPTLKGRLVAAMELAGYQPGVEGYSLELRDAAVRQVEELLKPLPLSQVVPKKRVLWSGVFAAVSVGLFLGYLGTGRERAAVGLINGFSPKGLRIELIVFPKDTAVLPGAEVVLGCRVKPEGVFRSVRLEIVEGFKGAKALGFRLGLQGDSCRFNLGAKNGFRYRFRVLGRGSEWFKVGVMEPMTLKRLAFVCQPPAYSGLPQMRVSGTGLAVLKGTQVLFEAEASGPVEAAFCCVGGESVAAKIDPSDSRLFSGSFVVLKDGVGTMEIVSAGTRFISSRFEVRVLEDEPPFVKIFLPGRDVDLPMSMQVPLGINSIDDYGLLQLWLHFGQESIGNAIRLKRLTGKKEDTTFYLWDLSGSGLVPGEAISYYVSVSDNDLISGPKSTRSEVYSVRFPTMPEIYRTAMEKMIDTKGELEPLGARQSKIGAELSRVTEELKKNRELSWEERKRLEEVIGEQSELLEQLEALKEDVAKATAEILEGIGWDEETLKRLGQLQELLSQLLPRDLQEALKELARKLGERPGELRQALERLQVEQDKLQEGIFRALELLQRIMEEVHLEALAREAQELARQQAMVTEGLKNESVAELVKRQEAINSNLDSLRAAMAKLAQEISEPAVACSLSGIEQEMVAQRLGAALEDLRARLSEGDRQTAMTRSEQMAASFKGLAERLEGLSEGLKKRRSEEVLNRLVIRAGELLTISEAQEGLEENLRQGAAPSMVAAEQMALLEATRITAESLIGIGAQTMVVPPTLGEELARGLNFMKEAVTLGSERRGANMADPMQAARTSLNRAVEIILDAAGKMQSGGGLSGSLTDLYEQISRMSAEQMAINAGTTGLPIPVPAGGLSLEQLNQLMGLLSRQQALREQLERLLESMGGERVGLTGSLKQLIEEMKGVERALSELQIDRQLIERQEGILSHLLDAERSLRQQGFKEERQSETAKEYHLELPSGLPADLGERNRRLREELMRALKQGYPLEYERLIRSYFERLLEQ